MTRPKKLHRPGGVHYVVLFGNGGQEIFQDEADKQSFMDLVTVAQARCHAEVLGYALTRCDARLVVRVSDVPVGRLVQRVATQYSRNNHAKYATAGYLFQHPYRAYLLDGTLHLLEIMRHMHRAPLDVGATEDLEGYRWSSHRAYLGLEAPDWLSLQTVHEMLANPAGESEPPQLAYRHLMNGHWQGVAAEGAEDAPPPSKLPSDDQFFSWLRRHAGKAPASVTVDQVIQAVARKMGVDRKRLLSTSRERRLTLTRALIGWHVTKNQIATLTEVSRQLGRDPSSVYTAYARYRAWRPQLFRDSLATILQYLDKDDSAREASALKPH